MTVKYPKTKRQTFDAQPQTKNKMKHNNSVGLLVNISFRSYDPKRRNAQAEREYADQHGTAIEANRTTTRLVPKKYVDPIQKAMTAARSAVKHLTAPFEDGGNRLVTAALVPKLQDTVARHRREWQRAVDDYCEQWQEIIDDAKLHLNGDFAKFAHLYPSAEEVKNRFRMEVSFMPMPDHNQLIDSVRDEMAEVYEQRIAAASADLRQRLTDKLRHLCNKCAIVGSEGKRFHDSNVTNVIELCELLPAMMTQDDPNLLEAIEAAREMLRGLDADAIKSSPAIAHDVRRQAESILTSLA